MAKCGRIELFYFVMISKRWIFSFDVDQECSSWRVELSAWIPFEALKRLDLKCLPSFSIFRQERDERRPFTAFNCIQKGERWKETIYYIIYVFRRERDYRPFTAFNCIQKGERLKKTIYCLQRHSGERWRETIYYIICIQKGERDERRPFTVFTCIQKGERWKETIYYIICIQKEERRKKTIYCLQL